MARVLALASDEASQRGRELLNQQIASLGRLDAGLLSQ